MIIIVSVECVMCENWNKRFTLNAIYENVQQNQQQQWLKQNQANKSTPQFVCKCDAKKQQMSKREKK